MKKNVLGIIALAVAISLSAFTNTKAHPAKATTNYFWYDLNGHALNGGVATAEPSTTCNIVATGCAKGFTSVPDDPQSETAQAFRQQNP